MTKKQFFLVAGLFLAISSCKNPDSIIGLNVQPPTDKLGLSIDTVTLETLTVPDSILRADKVLGVLGSDYSAVFGKTNASIYAQVTFGNTPVLGKPTDTFLADSLVLRLAYSGYYGDTNTTLTVHVYRLTESMSVDSPYNNNRNFTTDLELGSLTYKPLPKTRLTEYGNDIVPQLRIPLSKWLANSILSKNDKTELSSNDEWVKYFKGIYLKVDQVNTQGQGSVSYFNLASQESKMTLYFTNVTTAKDSLNYDFRFTGARLDHQEHDYTGTAVISQLLDSSNGDNLNYIQGVSGVKVKIKMPNILNFAQQGNIAINRAELIITRVPTSDTLSPPASLWLQAIDSTGKAAYILDQFESSAYYGGAYNSTTGQYTFNLTHYIQDVIEGKITDRGLYLGVSGALLLEYFGVIQAGRVTIGSGNASADPSSKMKLKLYYTKLN